jgi:hypothetical protein
MRGVLLALYGDELNDGIDDPLSSNNLDSEESVVEV